MKKRIAFVTTCMGRLAHVKVASPYLMKDPEIDGKKVFWVFVDYDCPDKSGDWVEEQYKDRVHVVRAQAIEKFKEGGSVFNKPVALNSGAIEAIMKGADYLCFIDADTIVSDRLLSALQRTVSPDRFLIMTPNQEKRDLTGFLCLHKKHWLYLNGYDPQFAGWGAEDLDMRIRLFLRLGLGFDELSPDLAASIPHEDDLRVQHYADKDKDRSHIRNLHQLCQSVFRYTGKHILDVYDEIPTGALVRRLLGVDLSISPSTLR